MQAFSRCGECCSLAVVHGLLNVVASLVAEDGLLDMQAQSWGARAQLPRGMWDVSSWTRDRTCVPCIPQADS